MRNSSVDEMRRIVEAAAAKADRYAGTCEECTYSRLGMMGYKCANPVVKASAFLQPDAYAADRLTDAAHQRGADNIWGRVICGPDGALFEAGLLRKLKDWLAPLSQTATGENP